MILSQHNLSTPPCAAEILTTYVCLNLGRARGAVE